MFKGFLNILFFTVCFSANAQEKTRSYTYESKKEKKLFQIEAETTNKTWCSVYSKITVDSVAISNVTTVIPIKKIVDSLKRKGYKENPEIIDLKNDAHINIEVSDFAFLLVDSLNHDSVYEFNLTVKLDINKTNIYKIFNYKKLHTISKEVAKRKYFESYQSNKWFTLFKYSNSSIYFFFVDFYGVLYQIRYKKGEMFLNGTSFSEYF